MAALGDLDRVRVGELHAREPPGHAGASSVLAGRPYWSWPTCAKATFAELAAGFGIGTATARRYVSETVALLAARSLKLHHALASAEKN